MRVRLLFKNKLFQTLEKIFFIFILNYGDEDHVFLIKVIEPLKVRSQGQPANLRWGHNRQIRKTDKKKPNSAIEMKAVLV